MDLLNLMVLLGIKNQAGPAQDPWPPKPSRSGPGPLDPQAKTKPVRPRTLGPPSQAGPAQDPWQYNRQSNRQSNRQYNRQYNGQSHRQFNRQFNYKKQIFPIHILKILRFI